MSRAHSISDILAKKYETINWSDNWQKAFGNPEIYGLWTGWGTSGSGKTSFLLQLSKELSNRGRVYYNSHEEKVRMTMQEALKKQDMAAYSGKVHIVCETFDQMMERLRKRRSPHFVILDSVQAARMRKRQIDTLIQEFAHRKLIILIVRAKGDNPSDALGDDLKSDADLKIQVKGFRAISHGRYNPGGYYTIWDERAAAFWGGLQPIKTT